jgi:ribosome-associated protein
MPHESTVLEIMPAVTIRLSELHFRTSRSGGPGGQNVNKLETRVELLFDIPNSTSLSREQKDRLLAELGSRVDAEGIVHMTSQASRSQWENKRLAIDNFVALLRAALKIRKKRVRSSPTRASKERRVRTKKKHSQKKLLRKVRLSDE